SSPTVSATIMGTLEIEGVPLEVFAQTGSNFMLYARLNSEQTIPLTALMKKYAPGVPAPSDLTVNRLSMVLSPGKFYQMSLLLADKPNPWLIPVGKKNIAIDKLLLELSSVQGGSVTGQFSGNASFGDDFQLAVNLTIPGSATMRGTFHHL